MSSTRSRTSHLRIARNGRVGCASSTGDDAVELTGRAMSAAAAGEEIELLLPAPSPAPEVVTRTPQAAAADVATLDGLARTLLERLVRSHRRVEVWAECSAGSVQIGNHRGVLAGYDVTLAGVGAVVESIAAGWAPPLRVSVASAGLPTLLDIEGLVAEVDRRLDPPIVTPKAPLPPSPPVCLAPRAAATFLRPLRAALAGHEAWLGRSPLRGRIGGQVFDARFTVSDEPVTPGRPGSRPIDDDGVVSRSLTLIEAGRVTGFLSDIQVGIRAGVPSTGHAWRTPFAPPRVGFTNFVVAAGTEGRAALLRAMGAGILIEDLEWGSGPNPLASAAMLRAPWAYLVEGGEVRGRLEGVVLSGDVFAALARLGAVGSDAVWIGAQCLPSLLLEGLGVSAR